MGTVLIIAGAALIIAGLCCTFSIIMDAFENELWMGIMCLIFFPYMIWYAFAEYDHDKKWLMVAGWLFGAGLGVILLSTGRMM